MAKIDSYQVSSGRVLREDGSVVNSVDMTGVKDMVWFPSSPIPMDADDEVTVAWANAGGKTWGLRAYYARRY